MAKVTSKLQVTVPKAIADQYGIRPGDEIDWLAAGEGIRVVRRAGRRPSQPLDLEVRLELFDQATARQRRREIGRRRVRPPKDRGWKREDLYQRGGTR